MKNSLVQIIYYNEDIIVIVLKIK